MTTARYLVGDVFERMAELPDGSVDLVMTSPPFLALRSYLPDDHPDKAKEIGSEATPAEFLDTLLALTAEWGRLLAPHGSICVELGDTYAGSGGAGGDYGDQGLRAGQGKFNGSGRRNRPADVAAGILAPTKRPGPEGRDKMPGWPLDKSLCGIPTLYAWSLAYGRNLLTGEPSPAGRWRVRNLVAWVRPNPPVGALGDKFRPATSYLTIATRARDRYFDLDAVRTPLVVPEAATLAGARPTGTREFDRQGKGRKNSEIMMSNPAGAPPLDWWNHVDQLIDDEIAARAGKTGQGGGAGPGRSTKLHGGAEGSRVIDKAATTIGATGSHIRRRLELAGYLGGPSEDVWDIPPGGFSGAHYAVYPPELCVRPILAMTPQRVCTTCGQPSRRIVERSERYAAARAAIGDFNQRGRDGDGVSGSRSVLSKAAGADITSAEHITVGWSDCGHGTWRPGHVLDPFAGSGTTLAVATGHGREATGIDLDPRNAQLAQERCGMFLTIHDGAVAS